MPYALGEVTEDEYTRKNDRLNIQILNEEKNIQENEMSQSEAANKLLALPEDGKQCLTKLIEDTEVLTRDIVVTFIRNIKVYKDKRIEIEWNFDF